MFYNLGKASNVIKCTTVKSIANATYLGKAVVDMKEYESVMFIGICSSSATNSTGAGKFHKQHVWLGVKGTSVSTGTYRTCYGNVAKSSSGYAAGVNKRLLILDIPKSGSRFRYVRPFVHGASSAAEIQAILAIQYNPKLMNSTGVNASTHVTGYAIATPLSTARIAGASSA